MSRLSRLITAPRAVIFAVVLAACGEQPTAVSADTTAAAVNASANCSPLSALATGQVVTGLAGAGACLTALSSAAEYALIPFNGATTSASASLQLSSTGTIAASALPSLVATNAPSFDLIGATSATPTLRADHSFEDKLRVRERAALTPLIGSARSWSRRASPRASLDAIPSSANVGQLLRLNANADDACTAPSYHGARVVAVTNRAIVVTDTINPAGGFTDAEYASLATTFDTLVDPLDRQAFGDPSDIDGNGRVVLFFTKAVNDLTPASSSSYVAGFFFARDLFPVQASTDVASCTASNVGEMFYLMVPDPPRGGAFSKSNVVSEVLGTLAHEYQHLINASRRMYVNTAASDFEETWLDEGLAHTAEELLFYRVSGLKPRQNIDPTALRKSAAYVSAFNSYQTGNFGRYDEYLGAVSEYSPYADNDSLATRGATWAFLRYAADRLSSTDGDVWSRLVNSTTTGLDNLRNVFGSSVLNEIRDWQTSVLTDDLTGVGASYQQQSWNYRAMYATLLNTSVFPIADVSFVAGARSVTLIPGASAYVRFTVAAGQSATIQWTGATPDVQFTLVRTK